MLQQSSFPAGTLDPDLLDPGVLFVREPFLGIDPAGHIQQEEVIAEGFSDFPRLIF
jgi:hypothetical protein